MIQMFRRALAAFSVALLLAGCGGGGNNPGTPLNKLNATIQLNSVNGTSTAVVNPQTSTVLVAYLKDGSGHVMAGQTIEFQVASSTGASGSLIGGITYTDANKNTWPAAITDANGIARITYVSPTVPASDTVNAIAVGATGTPVASLQVQTGQPASVGTSYVVSFTSAPSMVNLSGTAAITAHAVAVGANGTTSPAKFMTLSFQLGSTSSGTATTINSTSTGSSTSGTSSGTSSNQTQTPPTINGAYATYIATTDSSGNATISYKAGTLSGIDTIVANLMTNATASASVLASGSVAISVTANAPSVWTMALSGVPTSGTCTASASQGNQAGNTLACGTISANTIGNTGLQTGTNGVQLTATVTDSTGARQAGAVVTFLIGSSSTGGSFPYCVTPLSLTTSGGQYVCTDGAATPTYSTPKTGTVTAGFLTTTGTIATSLTVLTDANGLATAKYAAGGSAGTDMVLITAAPNSGTTAAPVSGTTNVTQSATMTVN